MKIAFSDYDGTLSVSDTGVTAETIEAIHAWRSSGNKFGIVTGKLRPHRYGNKQP